MNNSIYEPLGSFGVLSQSELETIRKQQVDMMSANGFVDLPLVDNYVPIEEKFKNIDTLDDVVLGGYIKDHWSTIVNDMYESQNVINRIYILRNVKFVNGLRRYLSSTTNPSIEPTMLSKLNYLIFNFRDDESNTALNKALTELGKLINRGYINKINSVVTVDEDTCNELVISRFSSADNILCAIRVNEVIMNTSMNSENIIDVYHSLYDHITDIFIGVMYDTKEILTSHEKEMYQNITTAILDYLEMQELGVIETVLANDIQLNYFKYQGSKRRFSVREIPADKYKRIIYAATELQYRQGLYVL